METTRQSLGERIFQVRKKLNMSQTAFGRLLGGIKKSPISTYEKGDAYPRPDTLAQIARVGGVSLDWLLTGEEAELIQGKDHLLKTKGEIAATIAPGRKTPGDRQIFTRGQTNPPGESVPMEDFVDESFSMSEMVTMTIEVLESKTVYRSALASNVRAFHQAVKMEGEMKGVKEEVQKMRAEHRTEMEELKEMIRALGGALPQKRDTAANA